MTPKTYPNLDHCKEDVSKTDWKTDPELLDSVAPVIVPHFFGMTEKILKRELTSPHPSNFHSFGFFETSSSIYGKMYFALKLSA